MSEAFRPRNDSHVGIKVCAGVTLLGLAGMALWHGVVSEGSRETLRTFFDECGDFSPFYDQEAGTIKSCAPLVESSSQETERGAFSIVLQPGSLIVLESGDYAMGATLAYEPGAPQEFFGVQSMSLTDWHDKMLEGGEPTRAFCVAGLGGAIEYIQENAETYASGVDTVQVTALEQVDNTYYIRPAGLGVDNPQVPDILIYDAASPAGPEGAELPCWTP